MLPMYVVLPGKARPSKHKHHINKQRELGDMVASGIGDTLQVALADGERSTHSALKILESTSVTA